MITADFIDIHCQVTLGPADERYALLASAYTDRQHVVGLISRFPTYTFVVSDMNIWQGENGVLTTFDIRMVGEGKTVR